MKCLSWARGTVSLSLLCCRWPGFSCPAELVLRGTGATIFSVVLGGEQGCPSLRKGVQILFKGVERRLTKYRQVGALSGQPSSHLASGTFYLPLLPPLNYLTGVEIVVGICWEGM